MRRFRTLIFTSEQLEEMLLAAYYSPVPTNLTIARHTLQMRIEEEWRKQQQERADV